MSVKPLASIAFMLSALLAVTGTANAQAQVDVTRLGTPVPTTHVLAIGKLARPMSADEARKIIPAEVTATAALYLDGKIEQWWVLQDGTGVAFLLNARDKDEAQADLAGLPLSKAGILKFELVPLGPLRPLQYLTDPAAH